MKGKWVSRSIVLAVLIVFCVSVFGCGSLPGAGPYDPEASYYLTTKTGEPGFLQGKKTVIFNIETVEREGATRQDTGGGNGLFGIIATGVGIGRIIAYNNSGKKFDETNAAELKKVSNVVDGIVANVWQQAYNGETVQAAYDFGKTKPKVDYFNKPNAALKETIAGICAENNAEFAVTIMQQIQHGYMDEGLTGSGSNVAVTSLRGNICVFDKTGNIVAHLILQLPNMRGGMDYGYKLRSNEAEAYAQLYTDGFINILTTIITLDTTSAAVVIEEQMKDVSLDQLQTTEDVEEE